MSPDIWMNVEWRIYLQTVVTALVKGEGKLRICRCAIRNISWVTKMETHRLVIGPPIIVHVDRQEIITREKEVHEQIVGDASMGNGEREAVCTVVDKGKKSISTRCGKGKTTNVGWNSFSTKARRYSSCLIRSSRYALLSSLLSEYKMCTSEFRWV